MASRTDSINVCTNFHGLLLLWAFLLAGMPGSVNPAAIAPLQLLPLATVQSLINAAPDGGTVDIPAGTYNESLTVDKNLTMRGQLSTTTIVQAISGQRVITVTAGHNLRLENLSILGGNPTNQVGGGVYAAGGNLQIVNCRIANNTATYGGGLFQEGTMGFAEVSGSVVENNTATFHGGGLYVKGSASLTNTQVLSNTAGMHGGGMYVDVGSANLIGGLFSDNRTNSGNGGGVNVNNGIGVNGTQFISNSAAQDGGGLLQWNGGQMVNVTNARFELNQSKRDGGGFWARGDVTLTGSLFATNSADSKNSTNTHGGGVYVTVGALTVISSTFTANKAQCTGCSLTQGGGLYLGTMTLAASVDQSWFEENYAWSGGGIYSNFDGLLVQHTTFRNNSAGYGGAMSANGTDVREVDFLSNKAVNAGGALNGGYDFKLSQVRFINNQATYSFGGAIWASGNLDAVNVLFSGSKAGSGAADMQLENDMSRVLRHMTFANSTVTGKPAISTSMGSISIMNSIISNYTPGIQLNSGTLTEDYNLFNGNSTGDIVNAGSGVVVNGGHSSSTQNPRFVNPAGGDFHLKADSPAIGWGTDLGVTIDLDGHPRLNGRADAGAYQFWVELFLPAIIRN